MRLAGELVLVVDDEPNIVELARLYLEKEGFRVAEARSGEEALRLFEELHPTLMVLDIMIPEPDGWEVCRRIRSRSTLPIIMLTAREDEVDKVVGLELGADDYLTKPFSPRELVARVKAVLRRTSLSGEPRDVLHVDDLVIDSSRRKVFQREREVELTPREFDLLYTLALNRGIVLSREKLLERVWGYDYYGDTRTVDVHIRHIRDKLGDNPQEPRYLETVWGVGYKFREGKR
ncbi:response regulator transcription factor [Candidatus Solincola tengchongensis]|uniref:response regulator transcription factor n=1 Tax=Candidatus Solincola tengchongensis TaxID=2900693 RepID=UPI003312FCF7